MTMKFFAAVLASGVSATALYAPGACAQTGEQTYNIEAQRLSDALRKYSDISGREVIAASNLLNGRRNTQVRGRLSPDAALSRLLTGTGLTIELVEGAWVLRSGNDDAVETGSTDGGEAIVVTGSRIRGAGPVGSPVVTLDRDAIEKSGYGTVQQLLQALPQNFGGGPTETTLGATTRNGAGSDATYGSSINLRGLGPSSTLVLVDGMRPPLGGIGGVFADISLIPMGAVERLEILTDGASAIYGADAVAGVVKPPRHRRRGVARPRLQDSTWGPPSQDRLRAIPPGGAGQEGMRRSGSPCRTPPMFARSVLISRASEKMGSPAQRRTPRMMGSDVIRRRSRRCRRRPARHGPLRLQGHRHWPQPAPHHRRARR